MPYAVSRCLGLLAAATLAASVLITVSPLDAGTAYAAKAPSVSTKGKHRFQPYRKRAVGPALSAEDILASPTALRRRGVLVRENATMPELQYWAYTLRHTRAPGPRISGNCLSCATAVARTLAGRPTRAVHLDTRAERAIQYAEMNLKYRPVSSLWTVFSEISRARDGAGAVVKADMQVRGSGTRMRHAFNVVKSRGRVVVLDVQKYVLLPVTSVRFSRVAYARVDRGITQLSDGANDAFGTWNTGPLADRDLDQVLRGQPLSRGFAQGRLNGLPVSFELTNFGRAGTWVRSSSGALEFLDPGQRWATWEQLDGATFKRVPAPGP